MYLILVHVLIKGKYLILVHVLIIWRFVWYLCTFWLYWCVCNVCTFWELNICICCLCTFHCCMSLLLVHALLIFLFMLHTLFFLLIHSNTFMFSLIYGYLIYVSILLANTSHKSRLILGLNRSRVSGEIPTCLPLVSNSIPYPVWVLRVLRVHQLTSLLLTPHTHQHHCAIRNNGMYMFNIKYL